MGNLSEVRTYRKTPALFGAELLLLVMSCATQLHSRLHSGLHRGLCSCGAQLDVLMKTAGAELTVTLDAKSADI